MATYKETKGSSVQNFSSDPSNPIAGQVWYNTTSNVLKISDGPLLSAWATANSMNTARYGLVGVGTQSAALAFGGFNGNPAGYLTETWNGTNWTEVNDMSTKRTVTAGGAGTNTAALAFGGGIPTTANTETWNGTNWTEVNNLNTARYGLAGAGTNTAALAFASASGGNQKNTETWNGTNWTEVNDLNAAHGYLGNAGTNTAALAFGGTSPSSTYLALTESWNGANWTEVNK